jgi:hypothetical protein
LGETDLGRFQLFGLAGLSSIDFLGDEISENDLFANPNQDAFVENQLGLVGLSHTIRLNKNTYLKSSAGISTNYNSYLQDNIIRNEQVERMSSYRAVNVENRENRVTLTSTLNQKFSARFNLQSGVIFENYSPDFFTETRDLDTEIPDENKDGIPNSFLQVRDTKENYQVSQVFSQGEYRFSSSLDWTFGLNVMHHSVTQAVALQPRTALSLQLNAKNNFSFAYGLHAQTVPSPVLFRNEQLPDGNYIQSNSELDFMKSHHWVFAWDRNLGTDWRLKSELYYQYLFDIPIENVPGSFSVINEGADFVFQNVTGLVNEGVGTNYGLEVTLEKFFNKGYYLLTTGSIYDSKYRASDQVWRSTAFDNGYVLNMLGGKEWAIGSRKINFLTFDTRLSTAGGQPFTPVDVNASRLARTEVLHQDLAFSENLTNYFRWDVKLGFRINKGKVSQQFFLDLQNVTNRQNEFRRRYNPVTEEVNTVYQIGFFPDVLYRVQF